MPFLETIHERKAVAKTAIFMALLLLSFFFIGLHYLDPPIEMGIEVNFGTSDTGSGDIQPITTEIPQTPKSSTSSDASSALQDETLTQDLEDAPITKPKPKTKPSDSKPVESKPKTPTKNPDKSTSDALNNILGAQGDTNQSSTGHGDDASGSGDKGQIDGNPYATAYYGGGSGMGTGYGLNGRNKTSSQQFKPDCYEEGRVVVQIEVDKTGRVINAIPGVKGTTNSAPCLLEPAKKISLSFKFNADAKAPNKQIGFVYINFTLGQ